MSPPGVCYYAYVIGDDGHISKRIDIVCDADDEAKVRLEALLDGHPIEIWQGRAGWRPLSPTIKHPLSRSSEYWSHAYVVVPGF